MKSFLAYGLLTLVAGFTGDPQPKPGSEKYPPEVGQRHPRLVLPSAKDGAALALSDFAGQRMLLLHFNTGTPACRDALLAWHEQTKELVKDHKLAIFGICHDASPAYARLFLQWKQIDWPIAHDPLNTNAISELPLAMYLNEKEIVKQLNPDPAKLAKKLTKSKALSPKEIPAEDREQLADPRATRRAAGEGRTAEYQCLHADALVIAGLAPQIDEAIEYYTNATTTDPSYVRAWFGLGVTHHIRRQRSDSAKSAADEDTKAAAKAWKKVRELAPDNEVYKVAIQQFKAKPTDEKLFGWMQEARKDITARGEKPIDVP